MEISGERNWSTQTAAYYPVLLLNIQCHSYLVENIAKKQHWNLSSNQDFQWNLANSQYILHMIIAYIVETISVYVWSLSIFFNEHISHIFLFLLIGFFHKIFIAFSAKNWLPLLLLTI